MNPCPDPAACWHAARGCPALMGAWTRVAGSPSLFEMRWKEPTGQDASELITRSRTELGYSCWAGLSLRLEAYDAAPVLQQCRSGGRSGVYAVGSTTRPCRHPDAGGSLQRFAAGRLPTWSCVRIGVGRGDDGAHLVSTTTQPTSSPHGSPPSGSCGRGQSGLRQRAWRAQRGRRDTLLSARILYGRCLHSQCKIYHRQLRKRHRTRSTGSRRHRTRFRRRMVSGSTSGPLATLMPPGLGKVDNPGRTKGHTKVEYKK